MDFTEKSLLICVLCAYAVLGALYAFMTPDWQVPDEPAHYNYVRHLVEAGRIPRLEAGDYDQDQMEQVLTQRFSSSLSLDGWQYENHQPPLYYLLAAPVHVLTDGSLIALRLFSLLLASGIVLLAYAVVRRVYPAQPHVALGTAAFIALLPQHNAIMAGVNNDGLAGLLSAALLLLSVRIAQGTFNEYRNLLLTGVTLGLGFVTKVTVYPMAVLVLVALCTNRWTHRRTPERHLGLQIVAVLVPALVIAAPWWIRNAMLYGWPDLLGLVRHDLVVEGQPRMAEWIDQHGWWSWSGHWLGSTFRSFWGQFGWMSAPMDFRAYYALALMTAIALMGCILPGRRISRTDRAPGVYLLALQFVLALLAYLAYNAIFVQPQGRYLFSAVIPIAAAFAIGWYRVSAWPSSLALALFAFMLLTVFYGVLSMDIKGWYLLITAGFAGTFWIVSMSRARRVIGVYSLAFGVLLLINLHVIFVSPLSTLR